MSKKDKIGRFSKARLNNIALQQYYDQTARASDVIVNTVPKSGTTMLQVLLLSLKLNGDFSSLKTYTDGSPWLERPLPVVTADGSLRHRANKDIFKSLDTLSEPRILKQHVLWSEIGTSIDPIIQSQIKYITVIRDIRDIPFSWHSHIQAFSQQFLQFTGMRVDKNRPFSDTFDRWLESDFRWQWYREFWSRRSDKNLLVLKFSDVVKNKKQTAMKIIQFLNWKMPTEKDLEEKILPKCSFEWMKENQSSFIMPVEIFDGAFVREGQAGKNKQKLDEEQLKRLRRKCEKELCPELVAFLYNEEYVELNANL